MGSVEQEQRCSHYWYEKECRLGSKLKQEYFLDNECPGSTKTDSMLNSLQVWSGMQSCKVDSDGFRKYEKDTWKEVVRRIAFQLDKRDKSAGDESFDSELVDIIGSLFAAANYLKRPIIVLPIYLPRHPKVKLNGIVGMYLPLMYQPGNCSKSPVFLGYDSGTFSVIVCDRAPQMQFIYAPIVFKNKNYLPIRLAKNEVGVYGKDDLLNRYLDTHWIQSAERGIILKACSADAKTQPRNRLQSRSACGGTFAVAGVDTTPGFQKSGNGNYDNQWKCDWKFQAPSGKRVVITFDAFETENYFREKCDYDKVTVYNDVAQTTEENTYCGSDRPAPFVSSGNEAALRFESDDSVTKNGIKFTWRFVDDSCSCGSPKVFNDYFGHNDVVKPAKFTLYPKTSPSDPAMALSQDEDVGLQMKDKYKLQLKVDMCDVLDVCLNVKQADLAKIDRIRFTYYFGAGETPERGFVEITSPTSTTICMPNPNLGNISWLRIRPYFNDPADTITVYNLQYIMCV